MALILGLPAALASQPVLCCVDLSALGADAFSPKLLLLPFCVLELPHVVLVAEDPVCAKCKCCLAGDARTSPDLRHLPVYKSATGTSDAEWLHLGRAAEAECKEFAASLAVGSLGEHPERLWCLGLLRPKHPVDRGSLGGGSHRAGSIQHGNL